jgi:hypothetical protein
VVTTYLRDKIDAYTAWQALEFSGRYTIDAVESPARSLGLDRSRTVLEGSRSRRPTASHRVSTPPPTRAVRQRRPLTSRRSPRMVTVGSLISGDAAAALRRGCQQRGAGRALRPKGRDHRRYGHGTATFGAHDVADKATYPILVVAPRRRCTLPRGSEWYAGMPRTGAGARASCRHFRASPDHTTIQTSPLSRPGHIKTSADPGSLQ